MLALVLSPPMPFYATPELDTCPQVVCPFTPTGRQCYCVPACISLGEW